VGEDPLNDIAFVKIKNVSNLTPATLGDSSQVEIGQKVIAIGNALGEYQNSVTSGIISGQGRPVLAQGGANDMEEQLDNLFQTDTAINEGNSGGPLLNLSGEVIGVNTAMAEGAENIGFSIPINATKGLVKSVIESGKIKKAYLGVKYISLTPRVASTYNLPVKQGAYIFDDTRQAVQAGSPADKAGLKDKDIVIKVNQKAIDQSNGMALLLAEYTPGQTVKLTIIRDGKEQVIHVTLGEFPRD
jgi:serine protease Do